MRKFLVNVEFDGKRYRGFQKNENAKTVQAEIESALKKLFEKVVSVVGSSRTDAGVSAKDFYFVFSADTKLPADRVAYKLNRFLPKDIVCQQSKEVPLSFDLKKSIVSKTYKYALYVSNHKKPLLDANAVWVEQPLDLQYMQICAKKLLGQNNYKSFCGINADTTSFERKVESIEIKQTDNLLEIYITAQNFLYNMVRVLVGTLIECGKHKMSAEQIEQLFKQKDRSKNPAKTMPAKALVLYKTTLKA